MTDELKVKQKTIIWWKDIKFLSGVSLIILSIIIGEFGKGLFIIKFYKLKYLLTGLFIWAFSWILLLLGVFLVGWETVKMIRMRIHHHVRKTVNDTYKYLKRRTK